MMVNQVSKCPWIKQNIIALECFNVVNGLNMVENAPRMAEEWFETVLRMVESGRRMANGLKQTLLNDWKSFQNV